LLIILITMLLIPGLNWIERW